MNNEIQERRKYHEEQLGVHAFVAFVILITLVIAALVLQAMVGLVSGIQVAMIFTLAIAIAVGGSILIGRFVAMAKHHYDHLQQLEHTE